MEIEIPVTCVASGIESPILEAKRTESQTVKEERIMNKSSRPLAILHLFFSMRETSTPYNEHCLALADKRDITICVYRKKFTPPKTITSFEGNGSSIGFLRVLKAALDEKEYDIIHVHAAYPGFLFLVANTFMRGRFMRLAVFTVHNSYQSYSLVNKLLLMPIFAFFRRVACCSKAAFESFPGFYKYLSGDRLCFIQNGSDIDRIDRFVRNTQTYLRNGNFTIVTVNRLIKIKNPLTVLKAFQQTTDEAGRLVFIGEGDLRELLITEIKECDLGERVELTGLIPREQVYEHLMKADLFISASRGEGLPCAVLEAMTSRCPVILSDIQPHREVAASTDFIPLIHPDDVAGFAREIKRFREMSPSERAQVGAKCRTVVAEQFSLVAMHKKYEEVYTEVTGKH